MTKNALLLELADVINIDDVGMNHGHQRAPLFVEEREDLGIIDVEDGFEGDLAVHQAVVCLVYDAHASAP